MWEGHICIDALYRVTRVLLVVIHGIGVLMCLVPLVGWLVPLSFWCLPPVAWAVQSYVSLIHCGLRRPQARLDQVRRERRYRRRRGGGGGGGGPGAGRRGVG